MQIVELTQGSPEWLAHRAQHFNASDAPAMMGCSKYKTRDALVRETATGLGEDITPEKQRIFDAGHSYEKLARPLGEEIIGEELYPVVGVSGKKSASYDGLTFAYDTAWEHKSLNDELRAVLPADGVGDERIGAMLPLMYRVQMEQQAEISGCERVLFTASKWAGDVLVEARHCWYRPDLALRAQIDAGWAQFEEDVAAYVPPAPEAVEVVGHSPNQLPALRSSVRGELVLESNIVEWETAALAYIKGVRDHELKTDEDFANAAAAAEWCETSKTTLLGVRSNLMSATGDVNTAVATLDRIAAELDKTRIAFNNAIKARKEARKAEIVLAAATELSNHVQALSARVGEGLMPNIPHDFPGVMKGLKSFASMTDKVNAELLRAKIEANRIADLIDGNLKRLAAHAEHASLFPDKATIVLKAADDLAALITARIAEHQKAEADRTQREADAAAAAAAAAAVVEASAPAPVAAPAPAAPAVRPFYRAVTPAAAAQPEPFTVRLGEIQALIAPYVITAEGLSQRGFPAPVVSGAQLYRRSDVRLICDDAAKFFAAKAQAQLQAA